MVDAVAVASKFAQNSGDLATTNQHVIRPSDRDIAASQSLGHSDDRNRSNQGNHRGCWWRHLRPQKDRNRQTARRLVSPDAPPTASSSVLVVSPNHESLGRAKGRATGDLVVGGADLVEPRDGTADRRAERCLDNSSRDGVAQDRYFETSMPCSLMMRWNVSRISSG